MVVRHGLVFVAARAVPGVLGMLTTIVLTHLLKPAEYGLYGLSLIVMTLGSGIAFDWLQLCMARFYEARGRDPKVIGTVIHMFALDALLCCLVLGAVWGLGLLGGAERSHYAMGVVMLLAYAWFELVAGVEIIELRSFRYFLLNTGRAVGVLIAGAGAAWLTHDAVWTGLGTASGMFAGTLLRGRGRPRLGRASVDWALAREMLAFGLPLTVAVAMGNLMFSGARALVDWLDSPAALGYYTVAFMLIQNTLVVVSSGLHAASYQMAVRAVESGDREAARRQFLQNGTMFFAFMAPAAIGVSLTAKGLAATLVAPAYAPEVAALTPWMAAGAFFATLRAGYFDYAFQLGHRPIRLVWVLGIAASASVALAAVLIPIFGPTGAAVAVTIAAAGACVHAYIAGKSAYPVPLPLAGLGRIAVACAMMAIAVLAVPGGTPRGFATQVLAGAAAYGLAAVALNILDARDLLLRRLRGALTGQRRGWPGQARP